MMMKREGSGRGGEAPRPREALREALADAAVAALCEPSRCAVFCALLEVVEADVGQLAQGLPQDRSVISRHLAALHDAGLVSLRIQGRRRIYQARGLYLIERLEALLGVAKAALATCCPPEASSPGATTRPQGSRREDEEVMG